MTGTTFPLKQNRRWQCSRPWALSLLVGWAFVAYINWAMHQPPEIFWPRDGAMPMPAYFLFPFETLWTRARYGHVDLGDTAPDFTVKKLEDKTPSNWVRCGRQTGRAGLRELYLTAISAGGSRPEQAGRAVQGQGRVLRGLHS